MKLLLKLLTLLISLNNAVIAQCFTPVGPVDNNIMPYIIADTELDMATAPNGDIYVAFDDDDYSNAISVMRFNGSNWEFVGPRGFSASNLSYVSIAVNKFGVVYVSYLASSGGIKLNMFNGSSWVTPIGFNLTGSSTSAPMIETDTLGNIYLCTTNFSSTIRVVKYDGVTTTTFATALTATPTISIDFHMSKNIEPYVAYRNSGTNKLCVKKFSGSWIDVGPPDFSGSSVSDFDIKTDTAGVPYVIYRDALFTNKAQVKKFDGTNWISVGTPSVSAGAVIHCDMTFSKLNEPYVVYSDLLYTSIGDVTVKKFDGTSWLSVSVTDTTRLGRGQNSIIAFNTNDSLYVAYLVDGSGVDIKKLHGPYWEYIRNTGININHVNSSFTSIYDKVNNVFYFAMCEEKLRDRVTVLKYQGGIWDTLGVIGFTTSPALSVIGVMKLALDTANVLYLAHVDVSASNKISVRKFNGSSWVYVGSPGFSPSYAYPNDFEIDENNVLYVSYKHPSTEKANVKYFNGGVWTSLGVADYSSGPVYDIKLAFDTSNVVYCAFRSSSTVSKPTCLKFNGSSWVNVGLPDFVSFDCYMGDLVIEKTTNLPYVSLGNAATTQGSVMKYNGTTWVYHGAANFSADYANDMEFNGNVLYVLSNTGLYYNVAGSLWVDYGTIVSPRSFEQIFIDETNTIYTTHRNHQFFFLNEFHFADIPAVTAEPAPAMVCIAADTLFGINAYGLLNSYQWQVNSGAGFVDLNDDTTYTGSNGDTLYINNSPAGFDGNIYQCVISSFCGADTTIQVILSVDNVDASFSGLDPNVCMSEGLVTLSPAITGGTFTGTGITSYTFDPVAAGTGFHTINYNVIDGFGCSDSSSQTINVLPITDASFTGLDSVYCRYDDDVTLTPINAGGIFSGPGVFGSTFNTSTSLGTYFITYTLIDDSACVSTTQQEVTVKEAVWINLPAITSFCDDQVTLDAFGVGTLGTPESFLWSNGDTNQTIEVYADGIFFVTVTDTSGCITSDTTSVFLHPLPSMSFSLIDTVCTNAGTIPLNGTPLGGTYSGPGIVGTNFNPLVGGVGFYSIDYAYTDSFGCTSVLSEDVLVQICLDVAEVNSLFGFSVFPNPANSQITITTSEIGNYDLLAYDMLGKNVISQSNLSGTNTLSIYELPNGVYDFKIRSLKQQGSFRIVVNH